MVLNENAALRPCTFQGPLSEGFGGGSSPTRLRPIRCHQRSEEENQRSWQAPGVPILSTAPHHEGPVSGCHGEQNADSGIRSVPPHGESHGLEMLAQRRRGLLESQPSQVACSASLSRIKKRSSGPGDLSNPTGKCQSQDHIAGTRLLTSPQYHTDFQPSAGAQNHTIEGLLSCGVGIGAPRTRALKPITLPLRCRNELAFTRPVSSLPPLYREI